MRLLIVGSLSNQIGAASRIAVARGAAVLQADTPEAGLEVLRAGKGADVVMFDVRLDIVSFMASLEAERIGVPVVACGTETDAKAAVRAIQAGAKEYIPLPPDAEMIAAVLEAIAEESHALLYADPRMDRIVKLAAQVAPSEASILVTGESGTGKEVIARFIHAKSRRATARFVAVNCAAIPENLLESELFGYEKGAFTGAVARRVGRFEEASGGTLLLDEISEMDTRLQAKLLRAIQEKEIDRLGGTKPVKVDTRIIATSNRDLKAEVKAGRFREDLYFRLNVLNLLLPPLRERKADIPLLAEHFVKKYAEANGLPFRPLSAAAREELSRHVWPGNVRELENTLHRAVLLATGDEIGPEQILLLQDADDAAEEGGTGSLVGRTVADVERDLIIDTLKHTVGNRTHAAHILGISIRTLRNKLRQYIEEGHAVPAPGEGEAAGP
ncbi:MAG: sigma-54-dependent transcriptional regulator [Rhodospirillaceae bacterium]